MSTTTNSIPPTDKSARATYPQHWSAYNAAQTREEGLVADLLRSMCDAIKSPPQKRGRPRIPLGDSIFAAVMKVYGTVSGRRTTGSWRDYEAKGHLDRAPHYNSVFRALESPALTHILKGLISDAAAPLRAIETDFAADSTGFSTSVYARWFDQKYGRASYYRGKNRAEWLKCHVMVGVTTNVVTAIEITDKRGGDCTQFPALLDGTMERFDVERVSADKAYSTKSILSLIEGRGIQPLIPFRKNANPTTLPYSESWERQYRYFASSRDEFNRQYHKRSNVETTFSMIKAKFGGYVRSKTPTAQVNEILCKVLCHNLCCLVQAQHEAALAIA